MDYQELEDVYEFHRNMRRTPWDMLFPHWFDTTDALLKAIGDEVERIKAVSIFTLLNAGIKPPVLLWQESKECRSGREILHFACPVPPVRYTLSPVCSSQSAIQAKQSDRFRQPQRQ